MQNHQLAEDAKGMCKAAQTGSHVAHGPSRMTPHLLGFGFWGFFWLLEGVVWLVLGAFFTGSA